MKIFPLQLLLICCFTVTLALNRYLATTWLSNPHFQTSFVNFFGRPPVFSYRRWSISTSTQGFQLLYFLCRKNLKYIAYFQSNMHIMVLEYFDLCRIILYSVFAVYSLFKYSRDNRNLKLFLFMRLKLSWYSPLILMLEFISDKCFMHLMVGLLLWIG